MVWGLIAFLGTGLLLLIVFVGYAVSGYLRAPHHVQRQIEAIRAAGEPVTLEELDAWYPDVPPEQNAAVAYEQAFRRLVVPDMEEEDILPVVGFADLPSADESLPEDVRSAAETHLADNAQALQLLHEAAQLERCRYPVDLSEGYDVEFPHLKPLRSGAKLLVLAAVMHAENGETHAAVTALVDSLAIARSLEPEPVLTSHLVRINGLRVTVRGCEFLLDRQSLTEDDLAELRAALNRREYAAGPYRALVGERCNGLELLAQMPCLPGTAALNQRHYLENMKRLVDAAQLPLHAALKVGDQIFAENEDPSIVYAGSYITLIATTSAFEAFALGAASLRCARCALAVEQYRLQHGALPDNLAELVPTYLDAVPTDPFDGGALRYKPLKRGYVVYSVGRNRWDDGGTPEPKAYRQAKDFGDIPFTVER